MPAAVTIDPQNLRLARTLSGDSSLTPLCVSPNATFVIGYAPYGLHPRVQVCTLQAGKASEWTDTRYDCEEVDPRELGRMGVQVAPAKAARLNWLRVPTKHGLQLYRWTDPSGALYCTLLCGNSDEGLTAARKEAFGESRRNKHRWIVQYLTGLDPELAQRITTIAGRHALLAYDFAAWLLQENEGSVDAAVTDAEGLLQLKPDELEVDISTHRAGSLAQKRQRLVVQAALCILRAAAANEAQNQPAAA